jgi:hypothetical protein
MNNKSWEGKGILRNFLRFLSEGASTAAPSATDAFATCRAGSGRGTMGLGISIIGDNSFKAA